MLWSLIKFVFFVVLIGALTLGAAYLLQTDGGIRIAVGDTELNLGPLQAVIFAVVVVAAVWLVLKLLGLLIAFVRFLNGDETAISRYFDRNRERKGFAALTEGIMAIASGEGRVAVSKAAKAERYLDRPELTSLVMAQAAELSGDPSKAEDAYKRLLTDDRTRFVGVRGLLKQKLAAGETDVALGLAQHAFALKPQNEEVQDALLLLQARKEDWSGARQTLAEKARMGALPRDVVRRRDAVLALGEAKDVFDEGQSIEAREAAIAANRLSPDLIPAAVMAAQFYIDDHNPKYATRVLRKAWESRPHPDLAAAFASIAPDETPEARLKRFEALTKIRPDDPETRLLRTELLISAGDFPEARRSIGRLVEEDPTSRSLALMAAIARGEGEDDAIVRGWLTKALVAPRGPQWVCDSCSQVHEHWHPVCSNCGGFDTLDWKRPGTGSQALPGAAEMLPMIVGTPLSGTIEPVDSGLPEADKP